MTLLGLPPVPPQLKSLSAYIQRADELKVQDPVIAYWCTYHAAQIGISYTGKDHTTNVFLGSLLDVLERMKRELASHDAIRDENVASAYVENFALKVFSAADNEDRAGKATRATAKRFLAAANFLEVLSVFNQAVSDDILPGESSNAEKIKYAKWKAADIAKAYREGRKPTPGSVMEELPTSPEAIVEHVVPATPSTPPPIIPTITPSSPPSIVRDTPPPPQLRTPPSNNLLFLLAIFQIPKVLAVGVQSLPLVPPTGDLRKRIYPRTGLLLSVAISMGKALMPHLLASISKRFHHLIQQAVSILPLLIRGESASPLVILVVLQ
ncbi:hypothetical protein QCA50_002149 [Cerrena zonata]|uniref:Vta1/callose synthase N-terminal domain-containing protein n=1 Tax=Cerrena zonata TaxID=2478898 RepID=A0AAW0GQK4_9APHY